MESRVKKMMPRNTDFYNLRPGLRMGVDQAVDLAKQSTAVRHMHFDCESYSKKLHAGV